MPRRRPSSGSSNRGSRRSGWRRLSTEPGAVGGTGAPDPADPRPARSRPTIDERAARRARLQDPRRDRYDALLRHLQAGREIPVRPTSRRRLGLDIDASAGRLLALAGLVVVAWFLAVLATDWLRTNRVDTWAGPDVSVQSGLRLPGCPAVSFQEDIYFPSWVRFEGKVFRWTDSGSPIGPNSLGTAYLTSGYTLGDLQLYRVANSLEGRAGRQIMLRQGTSPVGANYVVADCG